MISERRLIDELRDLALAVRDALGRLVVGTMNAINDATDAIHAASRFAEEYGWIISPAWPPALVGRLIELARAPRRSHALLAQAIVGYYEANEWHELDRLTEAILSKPILKPYRRKTLRDLPKIMRLGQIEGFNPAAYLVPTMLAQLEGILRDFALEKHQLTDVPGRPLHVARVVDKLRSLAEPVELAALDLIAGELWASHRNEEFGDPPPGRRFNRHFFLHGKARHHSKVHVVRVLLMIDIVVDLIYRGELIAAGLESGDLRLAWARILSSGKTFMQPAQPSPVHCVLRTVRQMTVRVDVVEHNNYNL